VKVGNEGVDQIKFVKRVYIQIGKTLIGFQVINPFPFGVVFLPPFHRKGCYRLQGSRCGCSDRYNPFSPFFGFFNEFHRFGRNLYVFGVIKNKDKIFRVVEKDLLKTDKNKLIEEFKPEILK
jgi:hypothetical protein